VVMGVIDAKMSFSSRLHNRKHVNHAARVITVRL
jgi:hypothetical protein